MPATLVWGKGFVMRPSSTPLGREVDEVFGIEGGYEPISWSSVTRIEDLTAQHGVNRELWPVYEGLESNTDIPLDQAQELSRQLLEALENIDPTIIEDDHWLQLIVRLLREGNSFFIMP